MRKLILVITFLFFIGVSPAFALTLFEEAFDGSDLPTTLTYTSNPDINSWYIDSSNRLYGDRFEHPTANLVFAAQSTAGFPLNDDGILYSADMGRPTVSVNPETNTVPGGSGIGLLFGGYRVKFNPGFPKDTDGAPGAFRIEEWHPGGEISTLVNNTNMGFIPALDYLHHVEVFVTMQGNDLNMDISISGLGTDSLMHTFNYSFIGSPSILGVGRVGVSIQGANRDDAFFDNLMVEGTGAITDPAQIPIAIDIKPKSCPNKLQIKKKNKGKLKVAILGTDTFNVRDIDKSTIMLEGKKPVKTRYRDVTAPSALELCDCESLPADTYKDLLSYFKMQDIVDALGDVNNGDEIPLTLTAKLKDEVTEIQGSDCVLIKTERSRSGRGTRRRR